MKIYFFILNIALCYCFYLTDIFDYEKEFNKNITEYFIEIIKYKNITLNYFINN